jgi:hypothetical protein
VDDGRAFEALTADAKDSSKGRICKKCRLGSCWGGGVEDDNGPSRWCGGCLCLIVVVSRPITQGPAAARFITGIYLELKSGFHTAPDELAKTWAVGCHSSAGISLGYMAVEILEHGLCERPGYI